MCASLNPVIPWGRILLPLFPGGLGWSKSWPIMSLPDISGSLVGQYGLGFFVLFEIESPSAAQVGLLPLPF